MTLFGQQGVNRGGRRLVTAALSLLLLAPRPAAGTGAGGAEAVATPLILDLAEVLAPSSREARHLLVPAPAAGIGPGSYLVVDRPDGTFLCTANFVWRQGPTWFLGTAGHCLLPARTRATHGPGADYDPASTSVQVCISACLFGGYTGAVTQPVAGSVRPLGAVAYARQTGPEGAPGNDFGLVRVPESLVPLLRPALPVFSGPTGAGAVQTGSLLCSYGGGLGTGETFLTMARLGVGISTSSDGRFFVAALPNAAGDSGAAVQGCQVHPGGIDGAAAVGVLTHGLEPVAGVTALGTTVPRAVALARQAGLTISLVTA